MDDRYVSFRGQDGNEAEEFIQAVRRAAFDADKDCDDRWMARFASTCMSGKALRWYESLDDDVQESWNRLRKAILVRYPPADEDAIVPSASAAPAAAAVPAAPASAPPTAAPWPSSFPQVDFAPPATAPLPSHAPKFASAPAPPAAEQWPSSFPQVDFASPAPIPPQNYTPRRSPAAVPPTAAQWPSSFPYVDFAPPAAIPPQSYSSKRAPAAAPPAAAQWPSSFPLVDFDPFAPAPSGSHTSEPSDKPFDGASGIIEVRYAETNRLMGYLSQKLRSNGAAQVSRSGRSSGQLVTVKNEPFSIYSNITRSPGLVWHKFIGMTWLHSDSARAPAGNLLATAVFTQGSDGSGSSLHSHSYIGGSEAAIWNIASDGKVTAMDGGRPLALYVYDDTNQIYLFPDFNSYIIASRRGAQQWVPVNFHFRED